MHAYIHTYIHIVVAARTSLHAVECAGEERGATVFGNEAVCWLHVAVQHGVVEEVVERQEDAAHCRPCAKVHEARPMRECTGGEGGRGTGGEKQVKQVSPRGAAGCQVPDPVLPRRTNKRVSSAIGLGPSLP